MSTKTDEERATETWSLIYSGLVKDGVKFPNNFDGIGAAYGGYARLIEAFTTLRKEQEEAVAEAVEVTENTSDGYHTFKELYEFRKIYNAVLFNEWAKQGKYNVHKSMKHSDGELCFGGGWFIVVATLPTGDISNHYEMKDWGLFQCEEREIAKEWDGHTAKNVVERLQALTPQNTKTDTTNSDKRDEDQHREQCEGRY